MIARLAGTILEKSPTRVVVDVAGVGYDVVVPLSTFYVLGEPGTRANLRIHTHVREDVLALYGFASEIEQQLFERLIAISGIGPRLALAVLSGIEAPDLVRAIRADDVVRLTKIPGVGRKSAERMVLELKDRLPAALAASALPATPGDERKEDLQSALENLGYARAAAEKAIASAVQQMPDAPFEQVLREILRGMIKNS